MRYLKSAIAKYLSKLKKSNNGKVQFGRGKGYDWCLVIAFTKQ